MTAVSPQAARFPSGALLTDFVKNSESPFRILSNSTINPMSLSQALSIKFDLGIKVISALEIAEGLAEQKNYLDRQGYIVGLTDSARIFLITDMSQILGTRSQEMAFCAISNYFDIRNKNMFIFSEHRMPYWPLALYRSLEKSCGLLQYIRH